MEAVYIVSSQLHQLYLFYIRSFLVDILDVEGTMDKLMTDFSTSWPFLIALLTVGT